MGNISNNYERYADTLQECVSRSILSLIYLSAALIVCIVIARLWYKNIKEDEVSDDPDAEVDVWGINMHATNDMIGLVIASVLVLCAFVGGCITNIHNITNYLYDKNNDAYVVVNGNFAVKSKQYGLGVGHKTLYTLIYEKDNDEKEVTIDISKCAIYEGNYTDTILVYASHSQVVVDVIEPAQK